MGKRRGVWEKMEGVRVRIWHVLAVRQAPPRTEERRVSSQDDAGRRSTRPGDLGGPGRAAGRVGWQAG